MRIALVPSAYAPAVGGVEELTARLAQQLVDSGDAVEVWTIRHPDVLPADERVDGVRVRRFPLPMPRLAVDALVRFPREAARARTMLVAAAAEFKPNIIHVQCFSANGAYAERLAAHLDVPLVLTMQGETMMDDMDIYEHSVVLRLALRRALRNAAAVTGCSAFVLADAESRFGLAPARGSVIPNGVEFGGAASEEALDLPFEQFVLGLGRVVRKKGFDLLLDAYQHIALRYPDIGLVIGGDGPERNDLIRAAAAGGLSERVVFPGVLSRAQVAWAMRAAAVFVLPSRIEPFGIVVLEALRAGCPTIVSPHGGATEIVRDGVQGLVVNPGDTDELARAIDTLLSDEELAKRLGRSARTRAADFAWDAIAQRYKEIYRDVTL